MKMHKSLASRIIGFISSLVLTLIAFLIFMRPDFFHQGLRFDLVLVLILALLQFTVQSICFLTIFDETGPRWNLVVFLSTLSIVLVIIVFTIWVMNHLNYRMM